MNRQTGILIKTIGSAIFFLCVTGAMPKSASAVPPDSALDPAAMTGIQRMSEYMTGLKTFSFDADIEYDAVQSDGQKIEFGAERKISIRRPDRIRVEAADRRGPERSLLYNGKEIVLFDKSNLVYASAAQSGSIDEALSFVEEKLHLPMPLRELLSMDLENHITAGLIFAGVVGEEVVDGVPCDHLALRNKDRGIQLWIERGDSPRLHRISITFEKELGQPQFRARFSRWDTSLPLEDSLFNFSPSKDTEKIKFYSGESPAAASKEIS